MSTMAEARWIRRPLENAYAHSLLLGMRLDGIGPSHFADPDVREIVSVVSERQRQGLPVDETLVLTTLHQRGAAACGKNWRFVLERIKESPPVADNGPEYARWIAAFAALEKIRTVTGEINGEIDSPGGRSDPLATLEGIRGRLTAALSELGTTRPLEAMGADEVVAAAARPLEWVVEPLFTVKGVRIIGGLGKTRKSTLAAALGLLTIKGGSLAENFRAGGGHSLAILDVENRPETWARKYFAVARGLGLDGEDLIRRRRVLYINRRVLYLDDAATLQGVIDLLRKAGVSEVVIDSLTGSHRRDESKAGEMRAFFQESIFRLRDEVGAGVTILHHHRKPYLGADDPSHALRGSSDLRNVVDTHLAVSRDAKDRSMLRLDVTAQREAEEAGPFYFRTEWSDGGPLTFSAVEPGDEALSKIDACRTDILALVEGLSDKAAGRQTIVALLTGKGYSERTINDALSRLTTGPATRLRKDPDGRQVVYRVIQ